MADNASTVTRARGRGFGRKSLALQSRMDAAAPIEQVDVPPAFELPADPRVAPVTVLPHEGQLSDLVGPFVTVNAQPAQPAYEYVPVSPAQLSPASVAQRAFTPRVPQPSPSYPAQAQGGPVTVVPGPGAVSPQTPSAVPVNLAVASPQTQPPAPAPVQVASPAPAVAPATPPLRPIVFSPQGQPGSPVVQLDIPARRNNVIAPVPRNSHTRPKPPEWPAVAEAVPSASPPSLAASLEAADRELATVMSKPVQRTAVKATTAVPPKKRARRVVYSHNSRHLSRTKQGMRAGNVVVVAAVLGSVLAVFLYWRAVGSPTSVESLPFIHAL